MPAETPDAHCTTRSHLPARLAAALLMAALAATACADSEPADDDVTAAPAAAGAATTTPDAPTEPYTITAQDYYYEGLRETYPTGASIVLDNASGAEVHEGLAMRALDPDQDPSELFLTPLDELGQVTELVGVAMAAPGEDSTTMTGPVVLDEPGTYLFICLIPRDAPADEVLAAAEDFMASGETDGAPAYPETGPPHSVAGMVATVTVGDAP